MAILGFVEDDHASVFVLENYWDRSFILVSDAKGRRGVLNFMVVGQVAPDNGRSGTTKRKRRRRMGYSPSECPQIIHYNIRDPLTVCH